MGWDGIGTLLGKLADRFIPSRKEAIANEIDKIEREIYDLQDKVPFTDADSDKYAKLSHRLSVLQKKARNN